MTNVRVIEMFIEGATSGKGSNLYIEGDKLINYTTCIAFRKNGYVHLNPERYSQTTSTHQNRIKKSGYRLMEYSSLSAFERVMRGD